MGKKTQVDGKAYERTISANAEAMFAEVATANLACGKQA